MSKIVQKTDSVLRQIARPVDLTEITKPEFKKIINNLSKALAAEADGVAIAAPQIGVSQRIFLIAGKVLHQSADQKTIPADLIFINPRIIKLSKKKNLTEEGCLSVRWWYGRVARAEKASVEAYDATGQKFTRNASGLLAQIFQHEIDHLDGILFIDKAKDLQEIKPETNA